MGQTNSIQNEQYKNRSQPINHEQNFQQNNEIKVLFLHGLESGVEGSKAKYLKARFTNFSVPDMQLSVYKLNKQNSLIRKTLSNWCSVQKGGMDCLQSCVNIAIKEINNFKPDIVIGSSLGGAVGCAIMSGLQQNSFKIINKKTKEMQQLQKSDSYEQKEEQQYFSNNQIWQGPILLLAPALDLLLSKTFNNEENILWKQNIQYIQRNNKHIYILHGDNDQTIPILQSSQLKEQYLPQCNFQVIKEGDHRLNSSLIHNDKLYQIIVDIVDQYKKHQKQQNDIIPKL